MPSQPRISAPIFEHRRDGLGIGTPQPRISWAFSHPAPDAGAENWIQSAYELVVKRGDSVDIETFHVESSQSVLVPWPVRPLQSGEAADVRIRCYGHGEEEATQWSPWARVEAALLCPSDWTAVPISSPVKLGPHDALTLRPVRYRKRFDLPHGCELSKACLYVTAHGIYEAHLNGDRVGDHILSPGWTSYHHRLLYQTFDVSSQLRPGANVLSIEVAEGWYAGRMGIRGGRPFNYGREVAALAQLEITFGGEKMVLGSDTTWKCAPSAILTSGIYDGEVYDMREEQNGWKGAGYDDSKWLTACEVPMASTRLIPSDAPPVRVIEEIQPVIIFTSPQGKTVVDFGQNVVGVVRIRRVPPWSRVSLTHAEVLEEGEMGIRPLRGAKCNDVVITGDHGVSDWSPKFTYHGFRYVQVDGWSDDTALSLQDFTALVLHTDMRRRGWFECSDPLVNQLHRNIIWSMRGNFVSLPTDCPQRDERLGWTGDIQVFSETANFLYDATAILSSWLDDVAGEQLAREDKIPGLVVPDVMGDFWTPTPQAVWHDAVVLTPWSLHGFTGDVQILERQYRSMEAWMEVIRRGPDRLWEPDLWQLGDWVDPAAPANEPGNGRTDSVLVADAYLVHTTSVMGRIAGILGLENSHRYVSEAQELKKCFQDKYITPLGNLANFTQTAFALGIQFDLLGSSEQRLTAGRSLARLVRLAKFHVSTGFAGTPLILPALTNAGYPSLAYRMLMEKHCPSWLYPVTMGATTVWERWDALLPDGCLNPGQMLSFNHYAFGAVAAWLHRTVGGISSDDGWKTVQVRPIPGGGLDSGEARFDGPYGMVECKWRIEGECRWWLQVQIPPNSRAEVHLPEQVSAVESQRRIFTLGSGYHQFSYAYVAEEWPPAGAPASHSGIRGTQCDCP